MSSVLVVDDRPDGRALLSTVLREMGYAPLEAESGQAALEVVGRSESVDLIIADILMPAMDGYEFVRELRPTRIAKMPVIFSTATYGMRGGHAGSPTPAGSRISCPSRASPERSSAVGASSAPIRCRRRCPRGVRPRAAAGPQREAGREGERARGERRRRSARRRDRRQSRSPCWRRFSQPLPWASASWTGTSLRSRQRDARRDPPPPGSNSTWAAPLPTSCRTFGRSRAPVPTRA